MNRKNRTQSSSLFLLELILAILFFSLASAVCVQFFVRSHLLSRNARDLNHAVNECSGIAEIVSSSDGTEDAINMIQSIYQNAKTDKDGDLAVRIYYNDALTPCSPEEGNYVLLAILTEEDQMLTADISMENTKNNDSIYQLTIEHYLQRRFPQ